MNGSDFGSNFRITGFDLADEATYVGAYSPPLDRFFIQGAYWYQNGEIVAFIEDVPSVLVPTFGGFTVDPFLAGNDTISGNAFDDFIYGFEGSDLIGGAGGADFLDGGPGRDTILGDLGNDSISGGDDSDELYGDWGSDTIWGGFGDDTINGNDGNDSIEGGDGNDIVAGGVGEDTLWGDNGNDTIYGDNGDDLVLAGPGNDLVDGGDGDDAVSSGFGDDTVYGGGGNDDIFNLGGSDLLIGGEGNDTIAGGDEDDELQGGVGNDTLNGGTGEDLLFGDAGNDDLYGDTGDDELQGGFGDDFLNGGTGSDLLFGEDGNDILFGAEGNDELHGGFGDDFLNGVSGDDVMFGEQGNDTLYGNAGNDFLSGGTGFDIAEYFGNRSSFTLSLSDSVITVADRRLNGEGSDQLVSIEYLLFSDVDIELSTVDRVAGLVEADFESFIELYIAYFNRAPDAIGLNFWGTAFANGTNLEQMASLFVDQDETLATYPSGISNQEFATSVYNNVLGRTPDQAGIDFWVGALNSGNVSRDQFILQVLRGAKSELKPEEGQAFVDQQLADRAYLENKVDIGAYFAVHRGMSDVNNASAAMALYDGSQGSINQAVAAIDNYYQEALDPNDGEFLMQVVGVLDNPFA